MAAEIACKTKGKGINYVWIGRIRRKGSFGQI